MKKNRPFVALSLATVVAITSVTPVFAQGARAGTLPAGILPVVVPTPVAPAAPEDVVAPEVAPQAFGALQVASHAVISDMGVMRGSFPQLTQVAGNPDFPRLNTEFRRNATMASVSTSFTVEDSADARFATITQVVSQGWTNITYVFIIDKSTGLEVDAAFVANAQQEAELQEVEEVEEVAEAEVAELEEEAEVEEEVEENGEEVAEEDEEDEELEDEYEYVLEVELNIEYIDGVESILIDKDNEDFFYVLGFEVVVDGDDVSFVYDGEEVLSFVAGEEVALIDGEEVESPAVITVEENIITMPLYVFELFLEHLASLD